MRTKDISKFQIRVEDENGNVDVVFRAQVVNETYIVTRAIKTFCLEANATNEYNNMKTLEDVVKFVNSAHTTHVYMEQEK